MKKYIYIILFFAIVTNWDIVSRVLGFSGNKYTIGNYTSEKWHFGHTGYSEAMKVSDQNEAPAIIYMYTDWCQYCKKFESKLLTNNEVNTSLARFVKIKINPETNDKDKQLYKQLNGKGYPTIMFKQGANGKLTYVRAPYTKNAKGWQLMSANQFVTMLHKHGS